MRKILGIGIFVLLLLVYAVPATAAGDWYVSGNVGVSSLQDADWTDTWSGGNASGDMDFDQGFGISGAIGHSWGAFRLEGELSYRKQDLNQVDVKTLSVAGLLFTGSAVFDIEGDQSSLGFMANGYYDFATNSNWAPFVMLGVGGSRQNFDLTSIGGTAVAFDESDTVFAYQAGVGIAYNISPSTAVNISYRFFGTADPTFDDGVDTFENEYKSHDFWVGVTFGL
jgi:opacity protein-like surface antigen